MLLGHNLMYQKTFKNCLIKLIQSLYHEQKAGIHSNKERIDSFDKYKGVSQGYILLLHLFSIFTEQVMKDSNTEGWL